jgi:hypothetical protein
MSMLLLSMLLLSLVLFLPHLSLAATCPFAPAHFRVGATAAPACTHDTIQQAIDDAGACPVIIDVTREHLYGDGGFCTPQQSGGCHLHVDGKSVTLQGWGDGVTCYALSQAICPTCPPASDVPLVTLDGNGSSGPVLSISSNSGPAHVSLRNLSLTHGATAYDGSGGGIAFAGAGSLRTYATTLANNYAGYGGAINVSAGAAGATLTLDAETQMIANTAQYSGGAIRIEGPARLFALQDHTVLEFNHALGRDPVTDSPSGGFGGGIEILGPARADIGSPGYNAAAIVSNNDAIYGAGVAAVDNGNGEAVLRLFADATGRPATIADNIGATRGGGVYLSGLADACLYASSVLDNEAADGAAIWFDNATSYPDQLDKGIFVNGAGVPDRLGSECGPETVSALGGSTQCARNDASCNAISGNRARHPDGSPAAGAIIHAQDTAGNGAFTARRVRLQGNVGAQLVYFAGLSQDMRLERCLVSDNTASDYLFYGGNAYVHGCTLAHDSIGAGTVFGFAESASLDLEADILDEVPYTTFHSSEDFSLNAGYLLTNSLYGLPSDNPSIVAGPAPQYVDAAHGDYHLAPLPQDALDFGIPGFDHTFTADLDGADAPFDLPDIPNYFGGSSYLPLDLGAYERTTEFWCGAADSLFCDGFEH